MAVNLFGSDTVDGTGATQYDAETDGGHMAAVMARETGGTNEAILKVTSHRGNVTEVPVDGTALIEVRCFEGIKEVHLRSSSTTSDVEWWATDFK